MSVAIVRLKTRMVEAVGAGSSVVTPLCVRFVVVLISKLEHVSQRQYIFMA